MTPVPAANSIKHGTESASPAHHPRPTGRMGGSLGPMLYRVAARAGDGDLRPSFAPLQHRLSVATRHRRPLISALLLKAWMRLAASARKPTPHVCVGRGHPTRCWIIGTRHELRGVPNHRLVVMNESAASNSESSRGRGSTKTSAPPAIYR